MRSNFRADAPFSSLDDLEARMIRGSSGAGGFAADARGGFAEDARGGFAGDARGGFSGDARLELGNGVLELEVRGNEAPTRPPPPRSPRSAALATYLRDTPTAQRNQTPSEPPSAGASPSAGSGGGHSPYRAAAPSPPAKPQHLRANGNGGNATYVASPTMGPPPPLSNSELPAPRLTGASSVTGAIAGLNRSRGREREGEKAVSETRQSPGNAPPVPPETGCPAGRISPGIMAMTLVIFLPLLGLFALSNASAAKLQATPLPFWCPVLGAAENEGEDAQPIPPPLPLANRTSGMPVGYADTPQDPADGCLGCQSVHWPSLLDLPPSLARASLSGDFDVFGISSISPETKAADKHGHGAVGGQGEGKDGGVEVAGSKAKGRLVGPVPGSPMLLRAITKKLAPPGAWLAFAAACSEHDRCYATLPRHYRTPDEQRKACDSELSLNLNYACVQQAVSVSALKAAKLSECEYPIDVF